jgi:hypothetical protein
MHPVAQALAPLTVLDLSGQPTRVLVWLRHFG